MIPVDGILVFCLYVLLFHELLTYFWSSNRQKRKHEHSGVLYQRRKNTVHEKGVNNNLDILWRRMNQASANCKVNGVDHAVITQVMADARAQRVREQQRISAAKIDTIE